MNSRLGSLIMSAVFCIVMSGAATAQAAQSAQPSSDAAKAETSKADQPSREQVLQLMNAMGIPQSVDESLHRAEIQVKDAARESFVKQNPDHSDEATLKKLDEVFNKTPFFKFEDVADAVIPIYQRRLSASDVQSGIDFYNSPGGKRLLAMIPEIMRESGEEGGKVVQAKMQAYGEQLQKDLAAFESEVHAQQSPAASQPNARADKEADEKSK